MSISLIGGLLKMVHRIFLRTVPGRTEEDLCIWKHILGVEGQVEGRLQKCDDECDGYNSCCEYYISQRQVRGRAI